MAEELSAKNLAETPESNFQEPQFESPYGPSPDGPPDHDHAFDDGPQLFNTECPIRINTKVTLPDQNLSGIEERKDESRESLLSLENSVSFDINSEETEQQSETSSMRDASILLNEYYDDEKCAPLNKIYQRKEHHHLQDYDCFDKSLHVLEIGIVATKFNYSNKGRREIVIRINKDHTSLQYRSKDAKIFEAWKDIKFRDLKGILYGGVSMTFKEQKRPVMRQLNKQRQSEQYIEWPTFGDK